ncbi:MAG: hypothetical protein ACRESO_09330, partial [Gammaproteobacteria bacterium]
MNRRLWIFALLSLIAVAATIQLTFFRTYSGVPFGVTSRGASGYVISPMPGVPLPSGLQNGDELDVRQMTPAARAAAFLAITVKSGLSYDVVVRRGNQLLTVPVLSEAVPQYPSSEAEKVLGYLLFLAFLFLGLLALWRGRDWAAWGLGVMALNVVIVNGLRAVPVPAVVGIGLDLFGNCVVVSVIAAGLYVMVHALVGGGLSRRAKWLFTAAFVA